MGEQSATAVGKLYARLDIAYLTCGWYRTLTSRQKDIFAAMLCFARMDRDRDGLEFAATVRRVGEVVGMSASQVHENIRVMVEKGALVVVSRGTGRKPCRYRLREPVELAFSTDDGGCVAFASDQNTNGCSVHGRPEQEVIATESYPQEQTEYCGEPYVENPKPEHYGVVVFTPDQNTLYTPNRGDSSRESPPIGTLQGEGPTCPKCGTPVKPIGLMVGNPKDPSKVYCPKVGCPMHRKPVNRSQCRNGSGNPFGRVIGGQDRAANDYEDDIPW